MLCLAAAGIAGAAEKRPLALDDIYRQEEATNFTTSPRGDEAVYVRNWYDVNFAGKRTALWRVDGATGRHEPLEPGEPDGRMPVYSPDGKWLAFLSDRDDGNEYQRLSKKSIPPYSDRPGQVRMLARGAAPNPIDAASHDVTMLDEYVVNDGFYGRLAFSRDGTQFAFVGSSPASSRRDFRSQDQDDQGEGYEGYQPSTVHLQTAPIRTGIEVLLTPDFARSFDNTEYRSATRYWFGDPQWTNNGKFIVFHANRTSDQESVRYSINKNYDLWRYAIAWAYRPDYRKPVQLTKNPGPDVSPRISPDGKHVLYLSVPRKGPHMDVFNLCVLPLDEDDAEPRVLVNAHDAERAADGTPPFQPTFPLRDDAWIDDEHVRVRGVRGMTTETLVFNIGGPDAPIAATATAEPPPHENKNLAPPKLNAWRDERFTAREEIVRWKSFDGLEIEGILTLPPGELTQFAKPYPIVVHPHGGPHSASKPGFNFGVSLLAAHGYAVFQPNYRGSYGYGRKFLDAARFDMGGADMQDILTGVDRLIERGIVDAKRQFVYGTSYGGYSTCRLVGLEPERFRAAVAVNAVTDLHAMWSLSDLQSWTEWEFGGKPWETIEHDGRTIDVGAMMRDRSPTTHAHKVRTPTLILHSDHDRRCPLAMGQMFYRCLKEAGCETELIIYQDERHGMWQVKHQADALDRVLDWFRTHDESSQ